MDRSHPFRPVPCGPCVEACALESVFRGNERFDHRGSADLALAVHGVPVVDVFARTENWLENLL